MRFVTKLHKPLVLLFLFCLLPLGALAQNFIKGTVNDESGNPVIGATIKVLGTNDGTVTDLDGNCSVKAKPNATLSISIVGYVTKKVSTGGGAKPINVVLVEDNTTLNDLVVIGYGTAKRSDISGSVASIDAGKMMKKAPINLADGLKGSAPGVLVTSPQQR